MTDRLKKTLKLSFAALAMCAGVSVNAQETAQTPVKNPPVSVEVMPGSHGVSFQAIVNKNLQSAPKIGFFGVTDFNTEWGNSQFSDMMIIGKVTVDLFKGLKLGAGFQSTPGGFRPSAALIYTYANPEWLVLAMPRIDLTKNATLETLGIIEYKPAINDKWRFYSRLQGTYVHAISDDYHARSYLRARAGVTVKEFTFGVGANMEYYGPLKQNETNIGGFLQVALF